MLEEGPEPEIEDEEAACREVQRRADRIASLIVGCDYPAIDVVIEVRRLKEFADGVLPGRRRLFEMIYESRFRRLWQQFRGPEDGELPEW